MKITKTEFSGLVIIKPRIISDSRGYFFESFKLDALLQAGILFNPVQDNESKSVKSVIRGLHYQLPPFDQAKLVRVIEGKVYDVSVDLRKNSSTFGKWFGIKLDSDTKSQLFIPKGFAHGISILSETAVIQYKCDNYYNPAFERGIFFKDPYLNIDWQIDSEDALISEKDLRHPLFKEAENRF